METIPPDVRVSGSSTGENPFWTDERVRLASWMFVALGILLRIVRYALGHPLWGDEAFLASNIVERDFLGLTKPLNYVQVSPILFLWVEKGMTLAFGFSVWSMRFVPIMASIAGLIVFRHLAAQLVKGPALILAVAILAVGYYPIRHGGEIKPYATDFLTAVSLLAMAVSWLQDRNRNISLWMLVAIGPIAIAMSHPAIFIAAGVGLVLLVPVLKTKRFVTILPLMLFGFATVSVFLLILVTVTKDQSESVMGTMREFWIDAFPPRAGVALIIWLLRVHTSHMFSYPAGGDRGASTMTTVCFLVGWLAMYRRGSRPILALLLMPFGLGLLAAFLGRYPYGGSARTMQYVAPSIALLAGLGMSAILSRWPLRLGGARAIFATIGVLAVVGAGLLGWDIAHPYKSIYDQASRDFAHVFWEEEAKSAELVCAKSDLGVALDPKSWQSDRSAIYICHREIFSGRHRRDEPVRLDRVSETHPLRVVVFGEKPGDAPGVTAWLASMNRTYLLIDKREIYVNRGVINRAGSFQDRYVIYDFVPKAASISELPTSVKR